MSRNHEKKELSEDHDARGKGGRGVTIINSVLTSGGQFDVISEIM